jgi:hypothetical protein
MTTATMHYITGYDRQTEELSVEHPVSPTDLAVIKEIAKVADTDPDALGSYPLSSAQLRAISAVIRAEFDTDRYDYFLEPFAE